MGRRALIVDDDPIIRNLIAALLTRKGIESSQAVNGQEAIELLEPSRDRSGFDLIMLDLMMPKVSGWDVIAFVEQRIPDLLRHIIVISAAGDSALEGLNDRGCGMVLQKPFEVSALYDAVGRCMRGPRDVTGGGSTPLQSVHPPV